MKQVFTLMLALGLAGVLARPLAAETPPPNPPEAPSQTPREMEEGIDLLSRGAQLLLRGLIAEMGPALEEMKKRLGDMNAYHPPEVLPNGDIIIRRKTPTEMAQPPEGEVEL